MTFPALREMVTWPSSRGCLRTSRAERLNSGSSSMKRTPLWARDISPGPGMLPPPSRPTSLMVWWGERKGRWKPRFSSDRVMPAADWMLRTSRNSSREGLGMMFGMRLAIMDLPDPGGPIIKRLWPPATATSTALRRAFWPLISEKSTWLGSWGFLIKGLDSAVMGTMSISPVMKRTAWSRESIGNTGRSVTRAASSADFLGRRMPDLRSFLAKIARARAPFMGLVFPERLSSPAMM